MMLSFENVARRWDVSVDTIRRMVKDGELAARRVRRHPRIPLTEVERIERGEPCPSGGDETVATIGRSTSGSAAGASGSSTRRSSPVERLRPWNADGGKRSRRKQSGTETLGVRLRLATGKSTPGT
jgi:excisionase family DNA binding protein